MKQTVLITGATDGIGLVTARMLHQRGHQVLLHGRNPSKLAQVRKEMMAQTGVSDVPSYQADMSNLDEVESLVAAITTDHKRLDVLINNAGVFRTPVPITSSGLDVRFVVNTLAPYLLTTRLMSLLQPSGRVINLSSAAQAPVNIEALAGHSHVTDDFEAYAQSKLALTMWSMLLGQIHRETGPAIVAVNPGSMLGTKMVQEGFGTEGKDVQIGADILTHLAVSTEAMDITGRYFDNDAGKFSSPHEDAQSTEKNQALLQAMDQILAAHL